MAMVDLEGGDDDIYKLFESQPSINLQDNESFRKLLTSAQGSRPTTTRNIPMRIGSSTGVRNYQICFVCKILKITVIFLVSTKFVFASWN